MAKLEKMQGAMTVSGGITVGKQPDLAHIYGLLERRTRQLKQAVRGGAITLNIGTRLMNTCTAHGCTAINGVTLSA